MAKALAALKKYRDTPKASRVFRWFTGPRILRVASLDGFQQRLADKGWHYEGGGAWGTAMRKGDLVWKWENSHDSIGYRTFVHAVLSGQFDDVKDAVPRFRMAIMDNHGQLAVLMPAYDKTVNSIGDWDSLAQDAMHAIELGKFAGRYVGGSTMSKPIHGVSRWPQVTEALARMYARTEECCYIALNVTEPFRPKDRKGAKRWKDCHPDYHGGNLMYARDGRLVIIDPLS